MPMNDVLSIDRLPRYIYITVWPDEGFWYIDTAILDQIKIFGYLKTNNVCSERLNNLHVNIVLHIMRSITH